MYAIRIFKRFIRRTNSALINYVNKKRDPEYFREATDAQILKEPDRFDSDGNQEFYVNAWNGAFHIGSYFI